MRSHRCFCHSFASPILVPLTCDDRQPTVGNDMHLGINQYDTKFTHTTYTYDIQYATCVLFKSEITEINIITGGGGLSDMLGFGHRGQKRIREAYEGYV